MLKIIDLTATARDPKLPIIPFCLEVILEPFNVHEIHGDGAPWRVITMLGD